MRGKDCKFSLLALSLCFLAMCTAAQAGTVTFNFNSIGPVGATNPSSVLTSQLGPGQSVTVSGTPNCSTNCGTVFATNSWNGDGHVVGTTLSGQNVGINSSNPSSNTFLMNNDQGSSTYSDIVMAFSGLQITGVNFQLEIFPDNTCQSSTNCSAGLPDFEFYANGALAGTGNAGTGLWTAAFPSGCQHSPASGTVNCEAAAQLGPTWAAGSSTGMISLGGVTTLDFRDWPAEIGIQSLTITYNTPTPEPGSLLLFGTGLSGVAATLRRRTKSAVRRRQPQNAKRIPNFCCIAAPAIPEPRLFAL